MNKIYQSGIAFSLMVFLAFYISRSSFSQLPEVEVSLNVKDAGLEEVLQEISEQTGYLFTYDAGLFAKDKKISVSFTQLRLEAALDSVFPDKDLEFKPVDRNIVIFRKEQQESMAGQNNPKQKEYVLVQGLIRDKKNKKPLPYANISIKGTHLGSISNQEGRFQLRVPEKYSDSLLVVSYIGYEYLSLPLPEESDSPLLIDLYKTSISLQEVIIRYQDPVYLLSESLKKIPENYPTEYSTIQSYFREYVKKSKKYLVFSEAVIEISKSPYQFNNTPDQVKLLKGRKIIAGTTKDTVIMKIKSGIANSLQLDIVKYRPDFLFFDFARNYDIDFSDIVSFKDQLVYELDFTPKEGAHTAIYQGKLYIDQANLALMAADFIIEPTKLSKEQDMFIVKKSRGIKVKTISAAYHVEYKETDSKYHLSQVRGEVVFKFRKKGDWLGSNYSLLIEMAVTNIDPGRRTRYKPGEIHRSNEILSDQRFEYDPRFWGDYNTIEPEKPLLEVIERVKSSLINSGTQ